MYVCTSVYVIQRARERERGRKFYRRELQHQSAKNVHALANASAGVQLEYRPIQYARANSSMEQSDRIKCFRLILLPLLKVVFIERHIQNVSRRTIGWIL